MEAEKDIAECQDETNEAEINTQSEAGNEHLSDMGSEEPHTSGISQDEPETRKHSQGKKRKRARESYDVESRKKSKYDDCEPIDIFEKPVLKYPKMILRKANTAFKNNREVPSSSTKKKSKSAKMYYKVKHDLKDSSTNTSNECTCSKYLDNLSLEELEDPVKLNSRLREASKSKMKDFLINKPRDSPTQSRESSPSPSPSPSSNEENVSIYINNKPTTIFINKYKENVQIEEEKVEESSTTLIKANDMQTYPYKQNIIRTPNILNISNGEYDKYHDSAAIPDAYFTNPSTSSNEDNGYQTEPSTSSYIEGAHSSDGYVVDKSSQTNEIIKKSKDEPKLSESDLIQILGAFHAKPVLFDFPISTRSMKNGNGMQDDNFVKYVYTNGKERTNKYIDQGVQVNSYKSSKPCTITRPEQADSNFVPVVYNYKNVQITPLANDPSRNNNDTNLMSNIIVNNIPAHSHNTKKSNQEVCTSEPLDLTVSPSTSREKANQSREPESIIKIRLDFSPKSRTETTNFYGKSNFETFVEDGFVTYIRKPTKE